MRKQLLKKLMMICGLVLLLNTFLQYQTFLQYRQSKIAAATLQLSEIRANLESSITNDLLVVQNIAHYFTINREAAEPAFTLLAEISTREHHHLRNLTVAQDYIVRYVYPLKGNEKVLGNDYRNLSDQWELIKTVGSSGKLVIQGPSPLIQGGAVMIGHMPIFKNSEDNGDQFWGMVTATLDIESLLSASQIQDSNLSVAIRGSDRQGNPGTAFYGNNDLFNEALQAITMTIKFPGGSWQLAAYPPRGWFSWSDPPPLAILIHLILALLAGILGYSTIRQHNRHHLLVQAQQSLDESQAIAHLGSWQISLNDKSVRWSRECYRIFGKDPESYQPTFEKSLALMHPDDRNEVSQRLERTIKLGTPYAFDHRLKLEDGTVRHVQGRGKLLNNKDKNDFHIHGTLLDITERKLIELALQESQKLNNAIGEASLDALITINSADEIIFWNNMAEKMLGWTREEALGRKLHQLIVPLEFRTQAERGFTRFVETGDGPVVNKVLELVALRKDSTTFPVDLSVSGFQLNNQFFAHGILRDATERKNAERKLRHLATTDELTKINNRRHFMELTETERQRHQRYQSPLSLVIFDIDHFKRINDSFGHDVGDLVLKKVAAITTGILRTLDIFGRFGGEEFTISLPQTDLHGALQLAERLRLLIGNTPFHVTHDRHINITVSLGVATLLIEESNLDNLIKRADVALYQAKNKGRNRVEPVPDK